MNVQHEIDQCPLKPCTALRSELRNASRRSLWPAPGPECPSASPRSTWSLARNRIRAARPSVGSLYLPSHPDRPARPPQEFRQTRRADSLHRRLGFVAAAFKLGLFVPSDRRPQPFLRRPRHVFQPASRRRSLCWRRCVVWFISSASPMIRRRSASISAKRSRTSSGKFRFPTLRGPFPDFLSNSSGRSLLDVLPVITKCLLRILYGAANRSKNRLFTSHL